MKQYALIVIAVFLIYRYVKMINRHDDETGCDVFVDTDFDDGWIRTDTTVKVER